MHKREESRYRGWGHLLGNKVCGNNQMNGFSHSPSWDPRMVCPYCHRGWITTVHPNLAALQGSLKLTADYRATVTSGYDAQTTGICSYRLMLEILQHTKKLGTIFNLQQIACWLKDLNDTPYRRNSFILKTVWSSFNYFTYVCSYRSKRDQRSEIFCVQVWYCVSERLRKKNSMRTAFVDYHQVPS